ncbi:stromal membrane-associated protein 1 isoform X2 [Thrips palmi]|uniref:Stromal membrane-associated protein 1 isoform X2 n=1 Tax=Thrips palmi TaxID=161013 RepID=A0A6P8Z0W3_THRPL|nr:stromal membrane-associated protein 1 isoform X2 [Thrips palmi]
MSSKSEKDRLKAVQDKCQQLLNEMLRDEDNKYCVDCDAKGPRWASWNLGIFLCIRCAGIHRNLGVHISKVKSVNLDTWTPEQVVSLQQMGNSRARAVYEANLPDNFRRPQTDSPLEAFVRAKYEQKKYIAREWVPPVIPKVNWDKEIEEEEQARRRRKESKSSTPQLGRNLTSSPASHSSTSEIPAPLPKPKSSASPKPSRTLGSSTVTAIPAPSSAPSSATLDLLGLDTPTGSSSPPNKGDDIFSGFLSAPPAAGHANNGVQTTETPKAETVGTVDSKRSAEENSFFNQPAATAQEKKQLTKDSILALYSSVPASGTPPAQVPAPQSFGVFPAQSMSGFGAVSAPAMGMNYPMSNGMMMGQQMPTAANGTQNGVFGPPGNQAGMMPPAGAIPNMTSNPFFNMTAMPQNNVPTPNPLNQLPQQMNMLNLSGTGSNVSQQAFGMQSSAGNPWATSNQPLGMAPQSIPQSQPSLGHTLATNLWQ